MNTTTNNSDDQHWDVFRYVAEEMTAEEELLFEDRLRDDQGLREQVGRMTMTLADVEQAFAGSNVIPGAPTASTNFRLRRYCVTAVAMIAIAALSISLTWESKTPEPTTESIAIAWAEEFQTEELESPELDEETELASLAFESDDEGDWIAGVVAAVNEGSEGLN